MRQIGSVVLALAVVASGCTGDDSEDATAETAARSDGDSAGQISSGEVTLAPATRPLGAGAVLDVEILEDRIIIPDGDELSDVETGDVLALGVTDQTPNGMLRYVIDVSRKDGRVVATTRQATLEETFEEADISASIPLTFDAIESVDGSVADAQAIPAGVGLTDDGGRSRRFIDLAYRPLAQVTEEFDADVEPFEEGFVIAFDEVLSDADDDHSTTDDQIRVSGSVTAVLNLELDLELGLDLDVDLAVVTPTVELETAAIFMDGHVATNLQMEAEQAGSFHEPGVELFAIEFTPIPVPAGPIVLVVQPRIPILLGWDGRASVAMDTSVTTSTNVRAGIEYVDGEWNSVFAPSGPDFDFNPPAIDGGEPARMTIRSGPRLEFKLYEALASGSVGVDGVMELELFGSSPWYCLSAGVAAPLGFELLGEPLVDWTIADVMYELIPDPCDAGADPPVAVPPVAGFSKVFGSCSPLGNPIGESGRMVAALDDGGVVIAARAERNAAAGSQAARFDDLWLLRLDAAGDVMWTRTYRGLVGDVVALVPIGDGFVIALETGRLLFVDRRGELRRSRRLQGLAFLLRGLVRAPGGELLALGVEGQDPVVAALEADGSVRWARRYTGDIPGGGAREASPLPGGGWNVAVAPGIFAIVDSTGEVQKAARLLVNGQSQSDYLYAAGTAGRLGLAIRGFRGTLFTVDADLNEATGTGTGTGFLAVGGLADGGFATTGGERIARVSPSGRLRWTVGYTDGAGGGFRELAQTSDGGIAVTGRTAALAVASCGQEFDPPGSSDDHWDVWLLKVPPSGLTTLGSESGVGRTTFDAEVWNGTQELIPIDLGDEAFPLTVEDDEDVPSHRTYPHVSEPEGGGPLYTIPASTFMPREPLAIVYEYDRGGAVSTRVMAVWEGDRTSVTAFDATPVGSADPPSDFRNVFGPGEGSEYCFEDGGCSLNTFSLGDVLGLPAFFPLLIGLIPNFHGPVPAIEVTETRTFAGVTAACGSGTYETGVVGEPGFGVIELCVDEATGGILYAYTRERCEDPDRTDGTCVELRAVEIRAPSESDFDLGR